MNFLVKKFSLIILSISFLFLFYTFFKSEIVLEGLNRSYYKTYYFLSSILILFSIISFFINYKTREYLIILGFSFMLSLYLFEGYLTFKKLFPKEQILKEELYENQTSKKWDNRTKIQIYQDSKKINNQIVVDVPPKNFFSKNLNILPLSGISNSETIYCNENGYYAVYQSDRYGFNNPDSEWDKKEVEYLLVGDSFTLGACVNRPYDIASVLRTISGKPTLNLGYDGNGPLLEYATLKEYLNSRVKKVIWIYYGNDFYNLRFELKNEILLNYLNTPNATQNLRSKQNEIDILVRKIIKEKEKKKINKSAIVFFFKLNETRSILNNYLPENQQTKNEISKLEIDKFKKILNLTKDIIIKNNSKLYFVYLPEFNHYQTNYDDTNYFLVKNIVKELNIPFIDIHKEVFEKEKNPLNFFPFKMPGHYNIEGYKKVAEEIYKFTKD